MKSNVLKLFFLALISLSMLSCENEVNEYPYQAEVQFINSDCGVYQIKIIKGQEKVEKILGRSSVIKNVYVVGNLPEELQQDGIKIELDLRVPKEDEYIVCTTMEPSLPLIMIIKARKIK